jgi:cobalt-precorrin 5A hydrolase
VNISPKDNLAVWVITPNGVGLAEKIVQALPETHVYLKAGLGRLERHAEQYDNLSDSVTELFHQYAGHVFIMAAGIVVRVIAGLLRGKTMDPAVVVVDDCGTHSISLLSGHIGGANRLALEVADIIGARPVITTATDVNQVPAVDVIAVERQLVIENPNAVKRINMALLRAETIAVYDPMGWLADAIPQARSCSTASSLNSNPEAASIFVHDHRGDLAPEVLVLRPPSLVAGLGCNRNTNWQEIQDLLTRVLARAGLASQSLCRLASIELKADEPGLLALAQDLQIPIEFFSPEQLNQVKDIATPSTVVEKHVGVRSVCEAAAILAARRGTLIVPKQSTRNVTVAIARIACIS